MGDIVKVGGAVFHGSDTVANLPSWYQRHIINHDRKFDIGDRVSRGGGTKKSAIQLGKHR